MNVPQLRFDKFDGEWKEEKLNNYAIKITKKNKNFEIKNVISNSAQYGLVSQRDFFDKDIANSANIDGYYVIERGDFVYNPRVSNTSPYGPVSIYKSEDKGVVSPLYLCFKTKGISKGFLGWFFKSSSWYRFMYENGDSGARHDRVNIKDSTFLAQPIYIPRMQEQEKVASFLNSMEKRINKQKEKVEKLEQFKKGMMQKIFSQTLRFKDEDGVEFPDWETKQLKEFAIKIVKKNRDMKVTNVISNSSKQGLISQRSYFKKDIANELNIDGYYIISKGDFVYNPRISSESPYGPVHVYELEEDGIVSPLYLCFKTRNIDSKFLKYFFMSSQWYKHIYIHGDSGARHDRVSIKDTAFFEMKMSMPSLAEQEKISSFLTSLNLKVKKEKEKLMVLEEQKKGFMQGMFV